MMLLYTILFQYMHTFDESYLKRNGIFDVMSVTANLRVPMNMYVFSHAISFRLGLYYKMRVRIIWAPDALPGPGTYFQ